MVPTQKAEIEEHEISNFETRSNVLHRICEYAFGFIIIERHFDDWSFFVSPGLTKLVPGTALVSAKTLFDRFFGTVR